MWKPLNNGQYYFLKLENRADMRGKSNKYCYVSPETRNLITTSSGAALLPGTYQWQRIEELVATKYFTLPLYNPTDYEITPDREVSRYDRFFEMCIKAKLFTELPKYRRVYDALGISFTPANRIHSTTNTEAESAGETKTDYGKTNETTTTPSGSETVTNAYGKTNETVTTPSGSETVKKVSDSGVAGSGTDTVTTGDISSTTGANTAFDTTGFADNSKNTNTVIAPARTVDSETSSFSGRKTEVESEDGGQDTATTTFTNRKTEVESADGGRDKVTNTSENESTVTHTGWDNYDIEGSIAANLEIAQTTLEKMIAEDIAMACTVGVFDCGHHHADIPDFIMEQVLWGTYDTEKWNELELTWKGASYNELYD